MGYILLRGTLSFENYSQTQIKLTYDNGSGPTEFLFDKRAVEIPIPDGSVPGDQLTIIAGVGLAYPNTFEFIYPDVILPVTSSVDEFRNIINGWLYTGGPEISINGGPSLTPLYTMNLIEGSNITLTAVEDTANNKVDITIDAAGGGGGGVTVVTGTSPISSTGGTTPDISIAQADSGHDGYLSSTDWNTFNGKVDSVTATGLLTSSGGTTPDISSSVGKGKLVGRNSVTGGIMEEISVGSGLTLSGTTLSANVNSSITHTTASGTDTYTATITGVTSYADGDSYLIRFTNGNTTGATLNINSLGAITLYRNNDGAMIGGDIEDGGELLCAYNASLNVFQCIGISPNSLIAYVTNADSVTITKGQPVYAYGGQGDRLTVKLAYNTSDSTSAQTVGLVMSSSIGVNQKGFIMMQGLLDGLSILPTATWSDGDPVYLGTTAGAITNTKQYAPNHLVYLGFVTTASNGSAGRLYVRVQNGYELDELHNVQAQSPTTGDTIYYYGANQWKTASIATILGYTPVPSTRTISTTAPLAGGGDLSANRTLSITQATASTDGYLSSTDWKIFNSKPNYLTAGNWNLGVLGNSTLSTGTLLLNTIKFYKIYTANTVTVTRMGCNITAAGTAGSKGRLGIYSDLNGYPSTLILDSGEFTCDTIAAKTLTGLSATLPAGVAWLCIVHNSASNPTFTVHPVANLYSLAMLAPAGGNNAYVHYSGTYSYAALPATTGALSLSMLITAPPAIYFYA